MLLSLVSDLLTFSIGLIGAVVLALGWRRTDGDAQLRRAVAVFLGCLSLIGLSGISTDLAIDGPVRGYQYVAGTLLPLLTAIFLYSWAQQARSAELSATTNALRRSEQLGASVAEHSPIGILILDTAGTVVFANPHAAEIVGATREAIMGSPYPGGAWEHWDTEGQPIDLDRLLFRRVLATAEPILDASVRIAFKGHPARTVTLNGAPLLQPGGAVSGVALTFMDVTDRILQAQHTQRLNAVLYATRGIMQLSVRERDADRLLQQACDQFVTTRGYKYAWIVRLGETPTIHWAPQAGESFSHTAVLDAVVQGNHPACVAKALADDDVHVAGEFDCRQCSLGRATRRCAACQSRRKAPIWRHGLRHTLGRGRIGAGDGRG